MAENKKSVLLYCDIIHTVEELDDADAGLLFKHYLRYINDQNPEPPSKLIKIVFEPIKQNLKRDLKKWDETIQSRSIAGKAGAAARWQVMANDGKRIEVMAKMAVTDTVNVTDTVILNTDVGEISKTISLAYNKRYDRDQGGQTGQDIDDLSKELLRTMPKKSILEQIRAHKLFIGLHNFKPPSKLECFFLLLLILLWI